MILVPFPCRYYLHSDNMWENSSRIRTPEHEAGLLFTYLKPVRNGQLRLQGKDSLSALKAISSLEILQSEEA